MHIFEYMKTEFRCSCPTISALVIIKQMHLENKKTFKDFTESIEAIATNILSACLKKLEEYQIIRKEKLPHNKKTNIYTLTKKGMELVPTIMELTIWTYRNMKEFNKNLFWNERLEMIKEDKVGLINLVVENYKEENWLQLRGV